VSILLRTLHPTLFRAPCTWGVALLLVLASELFAQYPPVVTRSRLDPSRGVSFHALLLPDTVYVGQQATYQIGVFLNQTVRQRLRRNPEFVPPETRSLLVYDLPDAKTPLVGNIDGRPYEVHVFQRAFFALTPGRYQVPPSKLSYALPQSASFFSREETYSLRSEPVSLVVLPVPTAGRPDDWAGAVGEWRTRLRVDSMSGRVGDPLVVTMRIEGRGNVTLLPRPRLEVSWASVVPADERVEFDSTASSLRGAKEFDWLVTPRQPGRRVVPSQRFAYFDPAARRYEVASSGALAIMVRDGDVAAIDSTDASWSVAPADTASPAVLSVRAQLGAPAGFGVQRSWWFLALLAAAPLPALAGLFHHRRRRARPAPTPARQLRDAVRRPDATAAELRRLAHGALRERLGLDVGLALADDSLAAALRHEGVTAATAQVLVAQLRALDEAVFRGASAAQAPSAAALAACIVDVDAEARRGGRRAAASEAGDANGARVAGVALLILLGAAAPLLARQDAVAERSWALAQTAYAGGDFRLAERHFFDVARRNADHSNAWANLGTAAWMASDTARAVQGWQRALRLRPMDREMRDRLATVRAVQDRGAARVPPVPVHVPAALLALVWCLGWWRLTRRAWRAQPIRARAAALLAAGALLAVGGFSMDRIQRGRDAAVASRSEPLRALPVLGAEMGPAPLAGEVAEVLARQGAWAQVRFDGGRQGWMAAEFLLPLGDD